MTELTWNCLPLVTIFPSFSHAMSAGGELSPDTHWKKTASPSSIVWSWGLKKTFSNPEMHRKNNDYTDWDRYDKLTISDAADATKKNPSFWQQRQGVDGLTRRRCDCWADQNERTEKVSHLWEQTNWDTDLHLSAKLRKKTEKTACSFIHDVSPEKQCTKIFLTSF